jgi:2-dehydro-3-deoxy-D-arabinonate dehydratase
MQLAKVRLADGRVGVGCLEKDSVLLFPPEQVPGNHGLCDILHAPDALDLSEQLAGSSTASFPIKDCTLLPPVDAQEVWAAGVTYKRSQEARERESAGAASFYDLAYGAPRPELFFKANARRVVGQGGAVRMRRDSRWNVPEPELALILTPDLRIVGYTIGNDMSSRDIEGENPLYLPQAKIYDGACALGPAVTLAKAMPPRDKVVIALLIERQGQEVYRGETSLAAMKRSCEELVEWLGREISFADGAILLTGTGVIPPDDFTLHAGDWISMSITGIGTLKNLVA